MDLQKLTDEFLKLAPVWGGRVAGALAGLIVALLVAGLVRRAVVRAMTTANIDPTLTKFISKAARWTVLAAALVALLGVFGIETTSFAALLGSIGLAVGLGFQGTLGSLSAGVMLLIFRPFKVDDVVTMGGTTAKVNAIDLFVTTLDTPDNRRIIMPNKDVFGSTIENVTYHPTRRVDVSVGTEYSADLDKTREVLLKAAASVPDRLEDPAPSVVIGELADSCVTWSVRVWTKTENFFPVKDALTVAVKKHLDAEGVGIPFPQVDVHLDKAA